MNRKHALAIAILLGVAAMLGAFAASRTVQLGAATRSAGQAQVLQRQQRLTKAENALRRALRSKPAATAAPRTVYVRPAPIIVRRHSGEGEGEGEGGFDD